jgi:hypothetical protein
MDLTALLVVNPQFLAQSTLSATRLVQLFVPIAQLVSTLLEETAVAFVH